MKITKEYLGEIGACRKGITWFNKQDETDSIKIIEKLVKEKKYDWADWLIVKKMKYKQFVSYAVFAAEQVIDAFERKYPAGNSPRKAIEAAKKCIESPTIENKRAADVAYVAADVARSAAATNSAAAAAAAAAYAARSASGVAFNLSYASCAVNAAGSAVSYAILYADNYSDCSSAQAIAAAHSIKLRIIKYGIELLNQEIGG